MKGKKKTKSVKIRDVDDGLKDGIRERGIVGVENRKKAKIKMKKKKDRKQIYKCKKMKKKNKK